MFWKLEFNFFYSSSELELESSSCWFPTSFAKDGGEGGGKVLSNVCREVGSIALTSKIRSNIIGVFFRFFCVGKRYNS